MSFSEEWHEARLRRINRDKLIAIEKTLSQDVVCKMIPDLFNPGKVIQSSIS